ncbi:hypothetical protein NPIL_37051 [Nephila pilipes]|uniref:Uncharacterized protein n=1 Tax=Nephila pilipes TaxID=299642 RepID=A0A8X6UEZ5_NEPPI|nr:hypothetical protein NPIL_37051 [Nephila pilipes]
MERLPESEPLESLSFLVIKVVLSVSGWSSVFQCLADFKHGYRINDKKRYELPFVSQWSLNKISCFFRRIKFNTQVQSLADSINHNVRYNRSPIVSIVREKLLKGNQWFSI